MAPNTRYELSAMPQDCVPGVPIGATLHFDPDGSPARPGQVVALWLKRAPAPVIGRLSPNPVMRRQTPMLTIDRGDGGRTAFYEWAVQRVDQMLDLPSKSVPAAD
jgi:hypothetical protein